MDDRKRLFALAAIMFAVAMLVAGIAIGVLYQTSLARQRAHLTEMVQSQARLVKSVARFDRRNDLPDGLTAKEAALTQIRDAHRQFTGFGKTGDFVMARRDDDHVVFIHRPRLGENGELQPLHRDSDLAEPMRRALAGRSGTMEGIDHHGETVLAAYESVAELNLGIVAKIDMAEVREPFIWAAMLVFAMALAFVGTGSMVLFSVGGPIIGKLAAGEARFRNITQSTGDGIVSIDTGGIVLSWNRGAERIFGYTEKEMLGQPLTRIMPARCQKTHTEALHQHETNEPGHMLDRTVEVVGVRKDGTEFSAEVSTSQWTDGEQMFFAGVVRDMSERKRAEDALRKLSRAVEQSPASVIITDTAASIEYVNPKFEETTGYSAEEVIGRNPRFLKSGETPIKTYMDLWRTITAGSEWRGELRNRKKSGEVYWESASISPIKLADGTITHFLAVKEDLTDRKTYEQALHYQANYDPLTELPNRALALDRLSGAIARAQRHGHKTALLFIDLDDFKAVNDSLGHETGDILLQYVAQRIVACVRNEDTVARMGGDEFTVILPDLRAAIDVEPVAVKIVAAFAAPFIVDSHELFVTPSIGITVCPNDGDSPEVLMKNADAAMYRAKHTGHNNFRFFTQEMNDRMVRRRRVESHLRHALGRNEFTLHYQPVVDLPSGAVVGAEALLRWRSPDLGFMPPDEFIPLAEATGLIDGIGDWVLDAACRQLRAWLDAGLPDLRVSVNVSGRQFRRTLLFDSVYHALEANRIAPGQLELEITESILLEDVTDNLAKVHELKKLGVRISIDDFGTGYSSLRYLKQFPVDALKIDKSFVRDVTTDPGDATIVIAMVNLARNLDLEVVAEGVETLEQQEFLQECECTTVQGFYIARPLPPKDFADFVRAWSVADNSMPPKIASPA